MNEFSLRLVGFDLDGTLLDTSGDLTAAVNHALATVGREPLSVAEVVARVGGGTRNMLTQALDANASADEALVDRLLPELLRYYEDHVAVLTQPYPGAAGVLETLRAAGVRIVVVTNKLEHLARHVLAATGLLDRVDLVIGGDTVGAAKPSPEPILAMLARGGGGPAAFVGDSIYDVLAAHAAGVPVVAVSFGYRDRPAGELGADAVIDRFADLLPVLATLAPPLRP